MFDMKQILVRISPALAKSLDRVAPGHGRKRSEFVRNAIVKALMEAEDVRAAEAYRRHPPEPGWPEVDGWAPESEAIHLPSARKRCASGSGCCDRPRFRR